MCVCKKKRKHPQMLHKSELYHSDLGFKQLVLRRRGIGKNKRKKNDSFLNFPN